jgi:hypothetical protein
VASFRSRSTAERGGTEDGREKAPKPRRADRRASLGAAPDPLRAARAEGLRRDPPAHAVRDPVPGPARETGVGERTLYRRLARFEAEGMESFFGSEKARSSRLPP